MKRSEGSCFFLPSPSSASSERNSAFRYSFPFSHTGIAVAKEARPTAQVGFEQPVELQRGLL